MTRTGKVVWSEGMHLGPQHFQMQGRYFEGLLQSSLAALECAPVGLLELQIDPAPLLDGILSLHRASGLWPDSTPFLCPDADDLPAPRLLDELVRPGEPSTIICLAAQDDRFQHSESLTPDLLTGDNPQPVVTARQRLCWARLEELGSRPGFPVLAVRRKAGGGFQIDESFHGPCLRLSAAPALLRGLDRLVALLEDRARTAPHPRDLSPGANGYSAQGIGQAWFLHTVNSSLASLRRIRQNASAHPERLYRELARLAGALCTFGLDTHPSDLPLYDHGAPAAVFEALSRHIQEHLQLVAPDNFAMAEIRSAGDCYFEGEVTDARWTSNSRWYLAMRSPMGDSALIDAVPRLVKFCSRDFVPKLVERALPGLPLRHIPTPPPGIAPRIDRQYFELDQVGPCWEHLAKSRRFGIYVPGEFGEAEMEVLILLGQPA
ncbi:MAG: type VI secretion system baseplate subunit TssK [Acidobacteria bacterium]|nr:type VI secretion system baseplate subunit TssK [Acidobacteriota bacterium]